MSIPNLQPVLILFISVSIVGAHDDILRAGLNIFQRLKANLKENLTTWHALECFECLKLSLLIYLTLKYKKCWKHLKSENNKSTHAAPRLWKLLLTSGKRCIMLHRCQRLHAVWEHMRSRLAISFAPASDFRDANSTSSTAIHPCL